MFGITTKQGGTCATTGPLDVCKTPAPPAPPIPTPYPNLAMCNQADPSSCSQKVKIGNQPVLTKDSKIPMSSGDEAGSAGGVVSGTIKGPMAYKTFSAKVKVEGANVARHLSATTHNGSSPNAPLGLQAAPSQTKVTVNG